MIINEIIATGKVGTRNLSNTIFYGGTGANLRSIIKNRNNIQLKRKVGNVAYGLIQGATWHRIYVAYDPELMKSAEQQEPNSDFWMEKDLYKSIIGFLDMTSTKTGWKGFEEGLVWMQHEYRGKGIGKGMYETAVLHDDVILISNESHTYAASRVWQSMIKDRRYTVYAVDMNHPDKPLPINLQADYIDILSGNTSKKVYSRKENQIRLVASRAG